MTSRKKRPAPGVDAYYSDLAERMRAAGGPCDLEDVKAKGPFSDDQLRDLAKKMQEEGTRILCRGGTTMSDASTTEKKPTASITLQEQLPERAKAAARLAQAAILYAMDVLRMNADMLKAVANVDDLAFRRDGGRIDMMPILAESGENPQELLLEAALAFADADYASREVSAEAEG